MVDCELLGLAFTCFIGGGAETLGFTYFFTATSGAIISES